MISFDDYNGGEAADLAFTAELTDELARAQLDPIAEGDGWAVMPGGEQVTWFERLSRPERREGVIHLVDPESFADYVLRYRTPDTVLYANRADGQIVAVFDDHPASAESPGPDTVDALGGFRRHRVILDLVTGEDWSAWDKQNRRSFAQVEFGDHVDTLAHTMVDPDAATMLDIATTLTGRQRIDIDSRTNLGNGSSSFAFIDDTQLKARSGKTEIEIPQTIAFQCSPWQGTEPITFEARLRVKAGAQGVTMLYVILRKAETLDNAFGLVIDGIRERIGDSFPIYRGSAQSY